MAQAVQAVGNGDPQLSQDRGPAQLAWQNRSERMPQFVGLDDAAAAAGSLANPTSPAVNNRTANGETPTPAYEGGYRAEWNRRHPENPIALNAVTSTSGPPAPVQPVTQLGQMEATDTGAFGSGASAQTPPQQPQPRRGYGQGFGSQGFGARPTGQRRFGHFLSAFNSGASPFGGNNT